MNQIIELHDSEVAAIWFDNDEAIIIFSSAYLHRSTGEPGVDAGSGWIQRAELVIGDADETDLTELAFITVYGGSLEIDGIVHKNGIPIPLDSRGRIKLKLEVCDADYNFSSIEIAGKWAKLSLLGEARYVEEFSGMDGLKTALSMLS